MGKPTVPGAKNAMRRAADEIIVRGPTPAQKAGLWAYFENRSVYCGIRLSKLNREGHLDHADHDGGNHLGNIVLSCGSCNGDEKREAPWREFIASKVSDPVVRAERVTKIEAWIAAHPAPPLAHDPDVEAIRAKIEVLADEYAAVCDQLRAAVQRARS